MVFDPRGVGDHRPVVIHNQAIAQVQSYKYLGVFIDNTVAEYNRGCISYAVWEFTVSIKNLCWFFIRLS